MYVQEESRSSEIAVRGMRENRCAKELLQEAQERSLVVDPVRSSVLSAQCEEWERCAWKGEWKDEWKDGRFDTKRAHVCAAVALSQCGATFTISAPLRTRAGRLNSVGSAQ